MITSWAWTTHQWTGGLKKRMVAGFPRPCLLKDFTIIILGQHEGFSRILRWPSLVFATSMTPFFQALGSKNYYGANSFLLEFIVYVNFLMLLLRLPALTPALKLTSSLLCLNLTELPGRGQKALSWGCPLHCQLIKTPDTFRVSWLPRRF